MDPAEALCFRRDFSIAQKTVTTGVSAGRAKSSDTSWRQWTEFTDSLGLDPFLEAFEDKVPILQVFGQRVRTGELAADRNPIRSRSVEDYIRHVAQTFLHVGANDPRLNTAGNIDFRLNRTYASWKKQDPPPNRVKPIPISVIRQIAIIAQTLDPSVSPLLCATADMIIIAFFFLLRPGEYTDSPSDTGPFTFGDVQLCIGSRRLNLLTCPIQELREARFATLTFTDQKNGVRGEVIGLGRSGDPFVCPVLALIRRVIHLREHSAPMSTPLAKVYHTTNAKSKVTPTLITKTLRDAVRYLGTDLGFLPEDVSARSLRAAGATALLVGKVDTNIITLLGRWRSDEMLRYLHLQAEPIMRDFSKLMLNADYSLLPNTFVPQH